MSYARYAEGDIYMYPDSLTGYIVCSGCKLLGYTSHYINPLTALYHLVQHVEAGDKVPERAIFRLFEESYKGETPENRKVIFISVPDEHECGDCYFPAKTLVIENHICSPGADLKPYWFWYWCGDCHIGG